MEAADLLAHFNDYWEDCENVADTIEARQQLISKIVDRVFVYDQTVIGIALHGDFGIILDEGTAVPFDVLEGLNAEMKKGAGNACTQFGSDGHGILTGYALLPRQNEYASSIRSILQAKIGNRFLPLAV